MNKLLDAVFNADYEFDIYFEKKIRFCYPKMDFKVFENRIFDFLTQKFFQKKSADLPFDAEFYSLQNGIIFFDFRR